MKKIKYILPLIAAIIMTAQTAWADGSQLDGKKWTNLCAVSNIGGTAQGAAYYDGKIYQFVDAGKEHGIYSISGNSWSSGGALNTGYLAACHFGSACFGPESTQNYTVNGTAHTSAYPLLFVTGHDKTNGSRALLVNVIDYQTKTLVASLRFQDTGSQDDQIAAYDFDSGKIYLMGYPGNVVGMAPWVIREYSGISFNNFTTTSQTIGSVTDVPVVDMTSATHTDVTIGGPNSSGIQEDLVSGTLQDCHFHNGHIYFVVTRGSRYNRTEWVKVHDYDVTEKKVIKTVTSAINSEPEGFAFDGTNFYVTTGGDGIEGRHRLFKLAPGSGYDTLNFQPAPKNGEYYEISTASQFVWFKQQVYSGCTTAKARLMEDIDMTNQADPFTYYVYNETTPRTHDAQYAFRGEFDGNGHAIKNVSITSTPHYNDGLFPYVEGANIHDLTVTGSLTATATTDKKNTSDYDAQNVGFIGKMNSGTLSNLNLIGWSVTTGTGVSTSENVNQLIGLEAGIITKTNILLTDPSLTTHTGNSGNHVYINGFCALSDASTSAAGYYETPEGDGTEASPYLINNAGKLWWFAKYVNGLSTGKQVIHAKLTSDINMEGSARGSFPGIGRYQGAVYAGTFDGQGHTISNFYVSQSTSNAGIFSYTDGATIKDFNLSGEMTVSGNIKHGSVVGWAMNTTIEKVYSSVNVTAGGVQQVGGLVGCLQKGTVNQCRYSGTITSSSAYNKIAGLSGSMVGSSIIDCLFDGTLTLSVNNNALIAGGLVACSMDAADNKITNCLMNGTISIDHPTARCGVIIGLISKFSFTGTNIYYNSTTVSSNLSTNTPDIENNNGTAPVWSMSATAVDPTAAGFNWGTIKNALNNGSTNWGINGDKAVYPLPNEVDKDATPVVKYTITFNDWNGTDYYEYHKEEVVAGANYNKPDDPQLAGYKFDGWTIDGNSVISAWPQVATEDVTYKAKYTVFTTTYTNGFKDGGTKTDTDYYEEPKLITSARCTELGIDASYNTNGYYEVKNAGNMFWIAKNLSADNNTRKYVMTDNINMAGNDNNHKDWPGISSWSGAHFKGTFDGNGKEFTNYYMNITTSSWQAMFSVPEKATIKNFTVSGNIDISSTGSQFGTICGRVADGTTTLEDIHSAVNITVAAGKTPGAIGGLVGQCSAQTTFNRCRYSGTITGNSAYNGLGGIVGNAEGNLTFNNCLFDGTISTTSTQARTGVDDGIKIGGIFGRNNNVSTITNCLSHGTISVPDAADKGNVGILVGTQINNNKLTITNTYYSPTTGIGAVGNNSNTDKSSAAPTLIETQTWPQIKIALNNNTTPANWGINSKVYPVPGETDAEYNNGFKSAGTPTDENYYETPEQEDDYYIIDNGGKLFWFANLVNSQSNGTVVKNVKITANINLEERPFPLIGTYNAKKYGGTFDGQGHTISGFKYEVTGDGTFGRAFFVHTDGATIKDFKLEGAMTITDGTNPAFIASVVGLGVSTTMEDVHSAVTINFNGGTKDVRIIGGLAGRYGGTMNRCRYSGTIDATNAPNIGDRVAGICAEGNSNATFKITNCLFDGAIKTACTTSGDSHRVGGIIAYKNGATITVKNCLSNGSYEFASTASLTNCGVLSGASNSATFENTYYTTTTTLSNTGITTSGATAVGSTPWSTILSNLNTAEGTNWMIKSSGPAYPIPSKGHVHNYVNGICTDADGCTQLLQPCTIAAADGYYEIANTGNLLWFGKGINDQSITANSNARLTASISDHNMPLPEFSGIGTAEHPYAGIFDGAGYVIQSTFTTASGTGAVGMFAYLEGTATQAATIKNLTLEGTFNVSAAREGIGALVGYMGDYTSIENVHSHVDINVTHAEAKFIGGIIGIMEEKAVEQTKINIACYHNTIDVTQSAGPVGGIVGDMRGGTIENALFDGILKTANTSSNLVVGGLAGQSYKSSGNHKTSYIKSSLSYGTITATSATSTKLGSVMGLTNQVISTDGGQNTTYYKNNGVTEAFGEKDPTKTIEVFTAVGTMTMSELRTALGETNWADGTNYPVPAAGGTHTHTYNDYGFCPANDGCYQPATQDGGYYIIDKAGKLYWFAESINNGSIATDSKAKLTADLDLFYSQWGMFPMIGNADHLYTGEFDGQGHTISNIQMFTGSVGATNKGMFIAASGANIHDFTVNGLFYIAADPGYTHGGITGQTNGAKFEDINCAISIQCLTETSTTAEIGGFAGLANGGSVINRCRFSGDMVVKSGVASGDAAKTGDTHDAIGGMFGKTNNATITNCLFDGTITPASTHADLNVGGIIGYVAGTTTMNNCFSHGTITLPDGARTKCGAVIGRADAAITTQDNPRSNYYTVTKHTGVATAVGTASESTIAQNTFLVPEAASIYSASGLVYKLGDANWYLDQAAAGHYPQPKEGTHTHYYENGFCITDGAYQEASNVDDVYYIANAGNLFWLAQQMNAETIPASVKITLSDDIDMEGREFPGFTKEYTGTFDGQKKTITNYKRTNSATSTAGFGFFNATNGATIKNLTIGGKLAITGSGNKSAYLGGLVGKATGTQFVDVTSSIDIETDNTIDGKTSSSCIRIVGGIVGGMFGGSMNRCRYNGTMTLDASTDAVGDRFGGLIGIIQTTASTISNCLFDGTIWAKKNSIIIGGIVGQGLSGSTIINSLATGTLKLTTVNDKCGMIIGNTNSTTITNTHYTTNNFTVGGVAVSGTYNASGILNDGSDWESLTTTLNGGPTATEGNWKIVEGQNYPIPMYFDLTYVNGFNTKPTASAAEKYEEPEQDAEGYYLIDNGGKMWWFATKVKTDKTVKAKLTANIDIEGNTRCVGSVNMPQMGEWGAPYTGIFDGQGFTISNWQQNWNNSSRSGLFGYTQNATIRNFTLEGTLNANGSSGAQQIGTVVGYTGTGTTLEDVHSKADINANGEVWAIGGIVGRAGGVVNRCWYSGTITAESGVYRHIGGIAGDAFKMTSSEHISNCLFDGTIIAPSSSADLMVGGILGGASEKSGEVNNCLMNGTITLENYAGTKSGIVVGSVVPSGQSISIQHTYYRTDGVSASLTASHGTTGTITDNSTKVTHRSDLTNGQLVNNLGSANWKQGTTQPEPLVGGGTHEHQYNTNGFCMAGDGYQSVGDPVGGWYEISNGGKLMDFAVKFNSGQIPVNAKAKLTADINLEGKTFPGIGVFVGAGHTPGTGSYVFTGEFDGQGHTIKNLYRKCSSSCAGGLFNTINDAKINNFHVRGTLVTPSDNTRFGGVIGYAYGSSTLIEDIYSSVDITANGTTGVVGGVIGRAQGTINRCRYDGTITGSTNFINQAAGICANARSGLTISNCLFDGTIEMNCAGSATTDVRAAGILAWNDAGNITLKNNLSNGAIHLKDGTASSKSGLNLCGIVYGDVSTNNTNDILTVSDNYYTTTNCTVGTIAFTQPGGKTKSGATLGEGCTLRDTQDWNPTILNALNGSSNPANWVIDTNQEYPVPANTSYMPATKYTIVFKDYNGTVIETNEIEAGDEVQTPEDPSRSGYIFAGWSPAVVSPAVANATYTAIYNKVGYVNGFNTDMEHCQEADRYEAPSQDAEGNYIIANGGQLYWFAHSINGTNGLTQIAANSKALLTVDIDMEGSTRGSFPGIGIREEVIYAGTFDGQGHTISGFYQQKADYRTGLFSSIKGTSAENIATVKNFTLKGTKDVNTTNGIQGSVAGEVKVNALVQDIISEVDITNSVNGALEGGLVGCVNGGTVNRCIYSGTLDCGSAINDIGGIAGTMRSGTISNCLFDGKIINTNATPTLGGIAGTTSTSNGSAITNCLVHGTITLANYNGEASGIVFGKADKTLSINVTYYTKTNVSNTLTAAVGNTTNVTGSPTEVTDTSSEAWNVICGYLNGSATSRLNWTIGTSGYPVPKIVEASHVHSWDENGFCTSNDGAYNEVEDPMDNYYQITNGGQLLDFAKKINDGTIPNTSNAKLTANINLCDVEFPGIGAYTADASKAYSGTFDGHGKTISGLNLQIPATAVGQCGFFNYAKNATIKDFTISGTMTDAGTGQQHGSVIGWADGTTLIEDVHSSVNVTISGTSQQVGGFAGRASGTFNRCSYSGTVSSSTAYNKIGGFVGSILGGTMKNCLFDGTLNLSSSSTDLIAGGFAGAFMDSNVGSMSNCLINGTVTIPNYSAGKCGVVVGLVDRKSTMTKVFYTTNNVTEGLTEAVGSITTNITLTGSAQKLNTTDTNFSWVNVNIMLNPTEGTEGNWKIVEGKDWPQPMVCEWSHTHTYQNGFCIAEDGAYQPATLAQDGYYEIDNAGKLWWIAQQLNAAENGLPKNTRIKLAANIDMEGDKHGSFPGICTLGSKQVNGNTVDDWEGTAYQGIFDGQGYTINNYYRKVQSGLRQGLFNVIYNNAQIKNFNINGSMIVTGNGNTSGALMGVVVGVARGSSTIEDINSSVNITASGSRGLGGIVGCMENTNNQPLTKLNRCRYNGTITISGTNVNDGVGGIAGEIRSAIMTNVLFDGTIIAKSGANYKYIGGIVGVARNNDNSEIHRALSHGTITLTDSYVDNTIVDNTTTGGKEVQGSLTGIIIGGIYKTLYMNKCFHTTSGATQNVPAIGPQIHEDSETVNGVKKITHTFVNDLLLGSSTDMTGSADLYSEAFHTTLGKSNWEIASYDATGAYPKPKKDAEHIHYYVNGFCTAGDGEYEKPTHNGTSYIIDNGGKLYWFAEHFNNPGLDGITIDQDATVELKKTSTDGNAAKAIDMEGDKYIFPGIGTQSRKFKGTFTGHGFTIKNFKRDIVNSEFTGLINYSENATIREFQLEGQINYNLNTDKSFHGTVVGYAAGTETLIEDVFSFVEVRMNNNHTRVWGGIAGRASGRMNRCRYSGTVAKSVTSTDNVDGTTTTTIEAMASGEQIGGICGNAQSGLVIENCLFDGTIKSYCSDPMMRVAGILASNELNSAVSIQIKNCLFNGCLDLKHLYKGEEYTGEDKKTQNGIIAGYWDTNTASLINNVYYLKKCADVMKNLDPGNYETTPSVNDTEEIKGEPNWNDIYDNLDEKGPGNEQGNGNWTHGDHTEEDYPTPGGKICNHENADGTSAYNEFGYCTICGDAKPLKTDEDGKYIMEAISDLAGFRDLINSGTNGADEFNAKLTEDIDFANWEGDFGEPIGNSHFNRYLYNFDGQGHKLLNVKITTGDEYIGFFGFAGDNNHDCYIHDFTITGEIVVPYDSKDHDNKPLYMGVVGKMYRGKIENVHSELVMKNENPTRAVIGGILGAAETTDKANPVTITKCSYTGTCEANAVGKMGGIIGETSKGTVIDHCTFAGTMDHVYQGSNNSTSFGGIVGYNEDADFSGVQNCIIAGVLKTRADRTFSDYGTEGNHKNVLCGEDKIITDGPTDAYKAKYSGNYAWNAYSAPNLLPSNSIVYPGWIAMEKINNGELCAIMNAQETSTYVETNGYPWGQVLGYQVGISDGNGGTVRHFTEGSPAMRVPLPGYQLPDKITYAVTATQNATDATKKDYTAAWYYFDDQGDTTPYPSDAASMKVKKIEYHRAPEYLTYYNSFCLPFEFTQTMKTEIDGNARIFTFNKVEGNKVLFNEESVNSIPAGTPFILYCDKNDAWEYINATETTLALQVTNPMDVGLYGSFDTMETGWGFYKLNQDGTKMVKTVGKADAQDKPESAPTDKPISQCYPYRAYFKLTTTSGAKAYDEEYIPCFVTEDDILEHNTDDNKRYNIMGQQVNENAKGIIIVNGKKYLKR